MIANPSAIIATILAWKVSINQQPPANATNMKKTICASFKDILPIASGRDLVLLTYLSISLSAISLITQPNDRVKTTPKVKITLWKNEGMPLEQINKAAHVGQNNKTIPLGLSNRAI